MVPPMESMEADSADASEDELSVISNDHGALDILQENLEAETAQQAAPDLGPDAFENSDSDTEQQLQHQDCESLESEATVEVSGSELSCHTESDSLPPIQTPPPRRRQGL